MIKINVVPYINTRRNERFKHFLLKLFNYDMLHPINCEKETIFYGWRGKVMNNWMKFINDDDDILEFYPQNYKILKSKSSVRIELIKPKTINDFINDMYRFDVKLYWDDNIFNFFEPKDILNETEIFDYYSMLLSKMGKSNELLM